MARRLWGVPERNPNARLLSRPGAAVLAPVNPPLPDPEVTPAFVRLADRRRDGRAPQPV